MAFQFFAISSFMVAHTAFFDKSKNITLEVKSTLFTEKVHTSRNKSPEARFLILNYQLTQKKTYSAATIH